MHRFALPFALVIVAAFATVPGVQAAAQRPITGWYTVSIVQAEPRCGPNAITLGFEGSGNAAHLGRMSGTASNCTEPSLGAGSVAIWDGVATFVAADGSTITVAYGGLQAAPAGGVATVSTSNSVISGTRRFAGASGSWVAVGEVNFATGVFSGSFSGWIRY
jgi:hypothetical protein